MSFFQTQLDSLVFNHWGKQYTLERHFPNEIEQFHGKSTFYIDENEGADKKDGEEHQRKRERKEKVEMPAVEGWHNALNCRASGCCQLPFYSQLLHQETTMVSLQVR